MYWLRIIISANCPRNGREKLRTTTGLRLSPASSSHSMSLSSAQRSAKIQAAKPAFIVNTFVGPAHASFYGQWAASGMKNETPIASQTFGEGGEILRMPPEVA